MTGCSACTPDAYDFVTFSIEMMGGICILFSQKRSLAVRDPLDATRTLVVAASGGADALYFYHFDGANLTPDRTAIVGLSGFPTSLVATPDGATAYAVQSDGKILIAGLTIPNGSTTTSIGLARFNSNGTLDTTFGTGGVVSQGFAGMSAAGYAVAFEPGRLRRGDGVLAPSSLNDSSRRRVPVDQFQAR